MATANHTSHHTPTPPRLRIAVGRKTGAGPFVMDPPLSQADIDAHLEASYVRTAAKQVA